VLSALLPVPKGSANRRRQPIHVEEVLNGIAIEFNERCSSWQSVWLGSPLPSKGKKDRDKRA